MGVKGARGKRGARNLNCQMSRLDPRSSPRSSRIVIHQVVACGYVFVLLNNSPVGCGRLFRVTDSTPRDPHWS